MVHANFAVTVVRAKNLPKADVMGKINAYAELNFDGEHKRTTTQKSNYDPEFQERFEFHFSADDADGVPELKINVYDHDVIKSNDFVGSVMITGKELHAVLQQGSGSLSEDVYSLHNQDKKVVGHNGRTLSELTVRVEVVSYGRGRRPAPGAHAGDAHEADARRTSLAPSTSPLPDGGESPCGEQPIASERGEGGGGDGHGAGEGAGRSQQVSRGPVPGGGGDRPVSGVGFDRGTVKVVVVEAVNLPELEKDESAKYGHSMMLTYAMVSLGQWNALVATPPRPGLCPFWGEGGGVKLQTHGGQERIEIVVSVRAVVEGGEEPGGSDEVVGEARIDLQQLMSSMWGGGGKLEVSFPLEGYAVPPGGDAKVLIAFEYPAGDIEGGAPWLPASPQKAVLEGDKDKFYESIADNSVWRAHKDGSHAHAPASLDLAELPFESRELATPEEILEAGGVKRDELAHIADFFEGLPSSGWGGLGGGDDLVVEALVSKGGMRVETAERFHRCAGRWRDARRGAMGWEGTLQSFIECLSNDPGLAKDLAEGMRQAQKRDLLAMRVELENARIGMELLKEFTVLPKDNEEGGVLAAARMGVAVNWPDIWKKAREMMEELAGKQREMESKECQCDIDPFENDIFVHYIPTLPRAIGGMAGRPDAGSKKDSTNEVKDTQSRILMATCRGEDGKGAGLTQDEMAKRKEELKKIAAGKGAMVQTVHEWSFEGAQLLDAALKPGLMYASNQTHPGTLASRRYVRGGGGVGLRGGTGEGTGNYIDTLRGL